MLITILVFLLILSILVLIHEAGHFFTAKKMGVKVEEFGFGFPPRLYGKKFGETLYSINWLPIGGFVKLYGEDEAGGGRLSRPSKGEAGSVKGKDIERAFYAKNPWQRALIVVAGVVMNFLLAVVILSYLFSVEGVATPGNTIVVASVAAHSPAELAGIHTGDTIISLNGKKISSTQQLIAETKKHLGEKVDLRIKDKGLRIKDIVVIPRKNAPKNEGAMGVAIAQSVIIKKYPWYQAPIVGVTETLKESWMLLQGLGTTVWQVFVGHTVPQDLAGPIGIAQLTGEFVKVGFSAVLSLVAMLSLNLAILNILPIPALDGGRLFFILIEAVTGWKVNRRFESYAHAIGMIVLLTLIALITFHDIFRIFTHQPLLPK